MSRVRKSIITLWQVLRDVRSRVTCNMVGVPRWQVWSAAADALRWNEYETMNRTWTHILSFVRSCVNRSWRFVTLSLRFVTRSLQFVTRSLQFVTLSGVEGRRRSGRKTRLPSWQVWGKPDLRLISIALVCLLVAFVVIDRWVLPLPEDKLQRASGTFVYSNEGYLLSAFTADDRFWRVPIPLDSVSDRLRTSVIAVEDRYFHYHPGINLVSLAEATVANVRAGHIVRGGSTLTMQIARMIEPKERTVVNKLLEMFRAAQLELRYSKAELLEMYLNLAPYGGNIEGIGAAAYFYFDKEPSELTWSEVALLTAIPNSPERFRPDLNPARAKTHRDRVLAILLSRGVITESECTAALEERIPTVRQPVPRTAPHFCQTVTARYADSTRIHSTVRYDFQSICERLAGSHRGRLAPKDIHNLAVVVIGNRSGEVLAMVGSPDFNDLTHSGQINGALAPRSPGSALKPFVYALAFENGLLSPEMTIADVPVNYSGYEPQNYDEQYHGAVSVREALVRSFNVPAVNTAAEVGLSSYHQLLKQAGLNTLEKKYYQYGLPLVLGAAEVRLLELANAYATLGRGGVYRPLTDLAGQQSPGGTRLLSEGASYVVTDILTELQRPDLPAAWESAASRTPVAWKTGTSYGRRDAWAIGYTPEYTVGVWAGNFDGRGSVDLVGADIAAPVMFDVFNEIVDPATSRWFTRPPEVQTREVCAVSGQPAGRFCGETREELFLVGVSPSARCSVHRPILVDRPSGLRLTAACAPDHESDREVVEIWPPRIASWMVEQGLSGPLPKYHPDCLELASGFHPVIVSPADGSVFELIEHIPGKYQKISLKAVVPGGDGLVHWFVDGELLAKAGADDRTFYVPARGRHSLLCIDDQGRSSKATFTVR